MNERLVRFRGGSGNVRVLLLEALDTARGVDQFLLAGEKWVAIGANFYAQHVALDGRTGLESVSASAVDGYSVIIGVDTGLHKFSLVVSGLRGNSQMEEYSHVARSRDNRQLYGKFAEMQNPHKSRSRNSSRGFVGIGAFYVRGIDSSEGVKVRGAGRNGVIVVRGRVDQRAVQELETTASGKRAVNAIADNHAATGIPGEVNSVL